MRKCLYLLHKILVCEILDIQCINIELKIGDKLYYIIALNRTPSKSQSEFENFFEKLQWNLDSLVQRYAFLVLLIVDLNAKQTGIKMTNAVLRGILLRMSHHSLVYNNFLKNQRIIPNANVNEKVAIFNKTILITKTEQS